MRQPSWAGIEAADAGPAPPVTSFHDPPAPTPGTAPEPDEDLLLLRAVDGPNRAVLAEGLLEESVGSPWWPAGGGTDLWELYDPSDPSDDAPVAVAATCGEADGRVTLVAVVVASWRRGRGIGHRLVEELADALRARGALALVAAVPAEQAATTAVLERAGFRRSAGGLTMQPDLVWFDLEL